MPPFIESGHNVTTEYLSSEGPFGSCRVALTDQEGGDTTSRPITLKGISTKPNHGDRKLSSEALRNRHVHHRPVQRDFRGVWYGSVVGATGKRHGAGV
jgi:hypothetical protein